MPCLLVHGGVAVSDTSSLNQLPAENETGYTWLISLVSADPFELNWYQATLSKDSVEYEKWAQNVYKPQRTPSQMSMLKKRRHLDHVEEPASPPGTAAMVRLYGDHIRYNAPWLSSLNFTPGIFPGLGSLVSWPFSAIGNLMENALAMGNRVTDLSIDVGLSKETGSLLLYMTDNGKGMPFTTLNKSLKRLGCWDGPIERRDTMRSHPTLQYGMGLKFAMARLGRATLLVSRCRSGVGATLFSQALNFQADVQTIAMPSCYWKLPNKDTVLSEAEHWRNQQKIQQYSPFSTAVSLAEQMNSVASTGTRLVFFDWHPNFPLDLTISAADAFVRLNSAPDDENEPTYTKSGADGIPLSRTIQRSLLSHATITEKPHKVPSWVHENLGVPDAGSLGWSSLGFNESITFIHSKDEVASEEVAPAEGEKPPGWSTGTATQKSGRVGGYFTHLRKASGTRVQDVRSSFPAWAKARDSIDCCLPTYLYWSCLFAPAILWHSGVPLLPPLDNEEGKSVPTISHDDPFKYSLYRYLKANLHCMVELEYLFEPADAAADAFGILGFLNHPSNLVEGDDATTSHPRVHETGILLYYKERLIKRMFVPFPAPPKLLDLHGRARCEWTTSRALHVCSSSCRSQVPFRRPPYFHVPLHRSDP